jgi:hypothetical protein
MMMYSTVFALLAVAAASWSDLDPNATCFNDGHCCGASCDNCCNKSSHKTLKCGQDISCSDCKTIMKALVDALQVVPDCSQLHFPDICKALGPIIPGVTVICPGFLNSICDWVLKKIKQGVSDPEALCEQLGMCGSQDSRCGCLPDGACNRNDEAGCCSGRQHKVVQVTCASGSRCGCHPDGECMAVDGPASDCCSNKRHKTQACIGQQRCGCIPDGSCVDPLGGAKSDCCSGVGHLSVKCTSGRKCGAVVTV